MLCGYLISNINNVKSGPLVYFTFKLNLHTTDYSLYFVNCRVPTDEKGGMTYPIFGFWYKYHSF